MKKADLDLYTDYLLSACGFATATGLSEMVDEAISHANDQDAEQSRVHVDLRSVQARVLESEKQAQPFCHVPQAAHQRITGCLR
jgi:hypothetical protein